MPWQKGSNIRCCLLKKGWAWVQGRGHILPSQRLWCCCARPHKPSLPSGGILVPLASSSSRHISAPKTDLHRDPPCPVFKDARHSDSECEPNFFKRKTDIKRKEEWNYRFVFSSLAATELPKNKGDQISRPPAYEHNMLSAWKLCLQRLLRKEGEKKGTQTQAVYFGIVPGEGGPLQMALGRQWSWWGWKVLLGRLSDYPKQVLAWAGDKSHSASYRTVINHELGKTFRARVYYQRLMKIYGFHKIVWKVHSVWMWDGRIVGLGARAKVIAWF